MKKSILSLAALIMASSTLFGQFRDGGKDGINVFETPKTDKKFDGLKASLGGAFTLGFQALKHSNTATPNFIKDPSLANTTGKTFDANKLVGITPGFNNAAANLAINVALADGVDLKMELYLSARHHQETWVKGGFIQFNKLPFIKLDLLDNVMKYTTLKMGHMEVNYGDAHFRRSDNGNTMYNPFIENYIMDAFATEIGAEADVNVNGFLAVAAISTGQIKGDQSEATPGYFITNATGLPNDADTTIITNGARRPAFIGKVGWDGKILENKLRIRATGSIYATPGSTGVTLYGGDRGGSNYWGVMDNTLVGSTFTKENIAFTSSRYNPSFGDKITSLMGNLFLEYKLTDDLSVESFTTYETSSGRGKAEGFGDRNAKQIAEDVIIRYGDFFLGGRYNKVDADVAAKYTAAKAAAGTTPFTPESTIPGYSVSVDRVAIGAGWFLTKNVMAKVEYTTQKYNGFPTSDIRSGGKFNGIVAQAVIGF